MRSLTVCNIQLSLKEVSISQSPQGAALINAGPGCVSRSYGRTLCGTDDTEGHYNMVELNKHILGGLFLSCQINWTFKTIILHLSCLSPTRLKSVRKCAMQFVPAVWQQCMLI